MLGSFHGSSVPAPATAASCSHALPELQDTASICWQEQKHSCQAAPVYLAPCFLYLQLCTSLAEERVLVLSPMAPVKASSVGQSSDPGVSRGSKGSEPMCFTLSGLPVLSAQAAAEEIVREDTHVKYLQDGKSVRHRTMAAPSERCAWRHMLYPLPVERLSCSCHRSGDSTGLALYPCSAPCMFAVLACVQYHGKTCSGELWISGKHALTDKCHVAHTCYPYKRCINFELKEY